uniref:Haloacid dehalogenase type II n=1 Tax=Thermorudis peleae TaxID=1382356 RepID=A0A831TFW1_9BACT
MRRALDFDAVVFDLYGTLADIGALAQRCRQVAGDAPLLDRWRAKQLEHAFLRTILQDYVDFWQVTVEALDAACAEMGIVPTAGERDALLQGWLELTPFPEVPGALEQLAGRWSLAVLSNGSPAMLETGLSHAGLRRYFQAILSADAVRRYKPDPAVYALAPAALVVPPERILFCSANGFDVAGAASFGLSVCWVNRSGRPIDALGRQPVLEVSSIEELATIGA